jgi:hypothetical protein
MHRCVPCSKRFKIFTGDNGGERFADTRPLSGKKQECWTAGSVPPPDYLLALGTGPRPERAGEQVTVPNPGQAML